MDQVEQIKNKIDMVELVGGFVSLKNAGRNFKGLCPFHEERTPSFMVNPELQIYKCFGCGKGGDAFSFVQDIEGVEFVEALEILADKTGVKLVRRKGNVDKTEKQKMVEVLSLATEYYHYLLTKHKLGSGAGKYLKNRGIGEKLIRKFKLGFALNSWDGLVQYLVEKKKMDLRLLERTGLVVRSAGGKHYDRFRGRVIFPLQDSRGRVVGMAGRVLPEFDDGKSPKYINSPETLVYHKSELLYGYFQARESIRKKDRVVVVEGELDMISSFASGVGEVVAIKGTALTTQQIKILSRLTKNLILALDADSAGEVATKRSIQLAEEVGMNIKVVQILGGKDPDDIARSSPGKWKKMVDKSVGIYDYFLEAAARKYDLATAEGKRKASDEVVPVLGGIVNQVVRAHFVNKLSRLLSVGEESVLAEMERVTKSERLNVKRDISKEKGSRLSAREQLERKMLSLLMVVDRDKANEAVGQVLKLRMGGLVGQVLRLWRKDGEVVSWIKGLPDEVIGVAEEAFLMGVEGEKVESELLEIVKKWEKLVWKDELRRLRIDLGRAEEEKELVKIEEIQHKLLGVIKKLND